MTPERPETPAREVLRLFREKGGSQYGGEAVSQLEHALEAAWFAEREGAPATAIVAALLHDVGHLLHDLPDDAPERGMDDLHEERAARWLARRFPDEVVAPVRLHVAAKRYLCATEPDYLATLSPPSVLSLRLQGGPMSAEEIAAFEANPHHAAAVALRRRDDRAKDPALKVPPLDHFVAYLERVAFPRLAEVPS